MQMINVDTAIIHPEQKDDSAAKTPWRDVFISHASPDVKLAESICEVLESNGMSCWIAPRDIPFGYFYRADLRRHCLQPMSASDLLQ